MDEETVDKMTCCPYLQTLARKRETDREREREREREVAGLNMSNRGERTFNICLSKLSFPPKCIGEYERERREEREKGERRGERGL